LVTLRVVTPLAPNFTLPNTRLLFEVVRSTMPVPLRATRCGLVAVLSLIESVALCAPAAAGVNATASVHEVSGSTVTGIAPHVPVPLGAYSESDGVALEITRGARPEFRTVRSLVTVWPIATFPNASEAVTDIEVIS
jgi:hypothetical protein